MKTIEPASIAEVAETLLQASRSRQRVAIRGGGTKPAAGRTWERADIVLSTARLNAIVAHRYGDLTATVQAGATLDDVRRALARHGQWIPLDPPHSSRATIGGIVATNDSGPRRHRYGAPRDVIIGVDVVLADGIAAKAGGIVVKNVAGYDLSRLMTGSFGSLGVIVAATFKLSPIPTASRTVVIDVGWLRESRARARGERLSTTLAAIGSSQLTPTAIELQVPPGRVLVRFETTEAAAGDQAASAVAIAERSGCAAAMIAGADEDRLWQEHATRPWSGAGAVIKVSAVPADVAGVLTEIDESADGADSEVVGRAGVGVLLLRIGGEAAGQRAVIERLRHRLPPGRGSAVVVRGSDELAASVDPWGPMGDAFPLMQAIKRRFDPLGILNPGAGPGGL